ncbi:MAG TPA: HdeD family acid-resistance protein, partial [Roseiarcus sp.]|nr:HdeD family acid-resistance protein [Roseiarcus sp.]
AAGEVHSLGAALHRLHDKWGAIVAFGVLLTVLGLAAVAFAIAATKATVVVNGVVFLIAGVAEIGVGMHSQGWGRFFFWVIGGLLYLISGLICIFNPDLASLVLTLMLGAGLIAAGIVRIVLGFQLPHDHPRALVFLAGAVTALLGLIIVGHWPADSVLVLGTLLGIDLLFHGAGWVSFGLGLRARR